MAICAPGLGSPATVVRPNGKKTKLAVWVMSPIPTASWSWDQRSIRRMTLASILIAWSAWFLTVLTITKPRSMMMPNSACASSTCKSKGWSPAIRTRSFGAVNATTSATISTSLIPNTGTFPDPVPGSKTIRSARGPFHLPGSAAMPMTSTTASMATATSTLTTSTCATQAGSRGPVRGPNLVSTTRCRIPLKSRTPTVVYTMLKTASC